MVSHGGQEYAYDFLSGILEQYPDLKIVTFDTPFKDANGETAKIDGVTQFFQQDAGFAESLVQAILDMYPDKTEAGEPVNILQVQQGAGYNSPFDRRQVGYEPFETDGKIKTVERIAPIDDQNATSSMRDVTAATLQKYGEGDIDGIWCCYDAYAQGVYQALREANSDIPMVSVDICNEDIQFMQEGKNWKACATTNWTSNGEFACRVLALEMADQYEDIELLPATMQIRAPGWKFLQLLLPRKWLHLRKVLILRTWQRLLEKTILILLGCLQCDWMVSALGH